jgi:hypothetical protein
VAERLGADAERRGLALALLGDYLVAAGLSSGSSGAQHWRQRVSCGVGVEGGDDGSEGGGGKLGSLTVQTKILPRVRVFRRRVTPLIPNTLLVSAAIAQLIPKMRLLVSADI